MDSSNDRLDKVDKFARYLAEGFGCPETFQARTNSPLPSVCADLRRRLDDAAAAILVAGSDASNHSPDDLAHLLRGRGLNVAFVGWVAPGGAMMAVL